MIVGTDGYRYEWIENWARIPETATGRSNGRTHGAAWSHTRGQLVVFHQNDPAVLFLTPDGRLDQAWGDRFSGAHGLTVVREGDEEFLWLVDQNSCEVVKTTLDGRAVTKLDRPDHPVYRAGAGGPRQGKYIPTWAAQNPANGEVWVADGYGSWLVHRYDAKGRYLHSLDGTEGAGAFQEPHGLNFVAGPDGPELFITDRANHRLVVYDGEGRFLRSSTVAHSPCAMDALGDLVLVPELFTGVKLIERETLTLVAALGDNEEVKPRADGGWWPPVAPTGWPDLAGTPFVRPGRFNSPHGACFSPAGDIYVVEWIVGGRITKLARCDGASGG
jgi:hypothetical protein